MAMGWESASRHGRNNVYGTPAQIFKKINNGISKICCYVSVTGFSFSWQIVHLNAEGARTRRHTLTHSATHKCRQMAVRKCKTQRRMMWRHKSREISRVKKNTENRNPSIILTKKQPNRNTRHDDLSRDRRAMIEWHRVSDLKSTSRPMCAKNVRSAFAVPTRVLAPKRCQKNGQ